MEKQILLEIEGDLFDEAMEILDEIGLDFNSAIKIFLKRLVKEGSIHFLLPKIDKSIKKDLQVDKYTNSILKEPIPFDQNDEFTEYHILDNSRTPITKDIRKSKAISLFSRIGVKINKNVTYASKNRTAYNYWANPKFDVLHQDWYLILNDWVKGILYLFFIPANSIRESELVARSDKNLIDLQITYEDDTFCDSRSGYKFFKFLINQYKY